MVEAIANGIEDKLIDGLSFRLNPGASYIVDRRSVTFHPQGSNIYTPGSGTKLIRIVLTGDNWLDPSTFRVMFNLVNEETTAGKNLRPIGGPWSFFQRMRVLCAGQLVEDIMDYNRIHQMMHVLIAKESRENDSAEAFGVLADTHDWINGGLTSETLKGISPQESMTVLFKPLSGILNQSKMLPIRYAPVTIELELVSDITTPIVSTFQGTGSTDFSATNTSLKWSINNVQVKCDLCTLDNALDNSYAKHLLDGGSLPINYNTFVSQMQTVSGPDVSINVSRALTRLKSVFVTLEKSLSGSGRNAFPVRKSWNDFFSPMSASNASGEFVHNPRGEFEFQLQIGSKLFPEYPIRSHAEAYYQLKKTLGVQASAVHNFDISAVEYRDHKFILGTDCERVLDAGFTGLNTRAGDLMTVKFKNASSGISNSSGTECLADRLHVILHSDQIMEIKDMGVQVFD
jgi:hypothetical protein